MPFTPLHCGPGMMVKALAPRQFSICVFTLTQVAMDVEVLWNGFARGALLHGPCHTYRGASVVAAVCFLAGKPASELIKKTWNRAAARCANANLAVPERTSWPASFTAAAFGAYSHILLDSMMHTDMQPLQPWSARNPLFGLIDPMLLQGLCLLLGVAGLVLYFSRGKEG